MSDEKLNGTAAAPAGADGEPTPIIFLDDIRVTFKTRTGSILHPNKVQAVRGLTLKLMPGQTLGIVGESGCGSPRRPTSCAACSSPRRAGCSSRART